MSKFFYTKLALVNIKKNSKTYVPFIITCILSIMMYFIMHSLSVNEELIDGSGSLRFILSVGVKLISIFSAIFLFYTNSFLIKRRKKEIGLYNVLGLEKKHIAKISLLETLFIFSISVVLGMILGIFFNKLMFLFLLKLLKLPVIVGVRIAFETFIMTLLIFTGIFTIIFLFNLLQIKLSNPIELLKGGQLGEKEPKTKWIITGIGLITLSSGYAIALSVESPLQAINLFFIAVILVMIGTYALFTSGSIALLKVLRKNKRYYYKTNHFISISSLIYRMKQNAIGLANICLLSTAVLIMLSGTIALYIGMEDALRTRFPRDMILTTNTLTIEESEEINDLVDQNLTKYKINYDQYVNYWDNAYVCQQDQNEFTLVDVDVIEGTNYCILYTLTIQDYNRLTNQTIELSDNEILIHSSKGPFIQGDITVNQKTYTINDEINQLDFRAKNYQGVVDSYVIILNDINSFGETDDLEYIIGFDVSNSHQEILDLTKHLKQAFKDNNFSVEINSVAANRAGFLEITGGLFFLGIFLGTLFLMATVLIIYYKQISEGYDDKERFEIIQKVGISKNEIKNTIRSQVLLIFFLPLIFTIIHIMFAFPIIIKLLAVLYLTNEPLYLSTTIFSIIFFSIIYTMIFFLTAKTYYKIVE